MLVTRLGWLAVLLLAGCTDDDRPDLFVDVRTDLRPGYEFASVRVELLGASTAGPARATATAAVGEDESYLSGRRIAELADVAPKQASVVVALLDADGRPVLERTASFRMGSEDRLVTVVLTRDCRGVVCPAPDGDPTATACLAGRCVQDSCTPESPESCPAGGCAADGDCPATSGCSLGRCVEGVCFQSARDGECAEGTWCSPGAGCLAIHGGVDGGVAMPDAAMDAAASGDGGTDSGTEACGWLARPPTDGGGADASVDAGALDGGSGDGGAGAVGTCEAPLDLAGASLPDGTYELYAQLDDYPDAHRGSCSCDCEGREVVLRLIPPVDVMMRALTSSYVEPDGWRDTVLYARTVCDDAATELGCNDDDPNDYHSVLDARLRGGVPVYLFFENLSSPYPGTDHLRVRLDPLLAEGEPCDPDAPDRRCGFGLGCRSESGAAPVCLRSVCGDGLREDTEQCDDGNVDACDGCGPDCTREGGTCEVPIDLAFAGTRDGDGTIRYRASAMGAPIQIASACSIEPVSPDIVFSYTPAADGVLRVAADTSGTHYAPVLSIRTGCSSLGTELGCSAAQWTARTASTEAEVRAGERHYVVLEHYLPWTRELVAFEHRDFELTARLHPFLAPGAPCDPASTDDRCPYDHACLDDGSGTRVCRATVCGDGLREGREECDSVPADDGCTTSCTLRDPGNGGAGCGDAVPLPLAEVAPGVLEGRATGDTVGGGVAGDGACTFSETIAERVYTLTIPDTRDVELTVSAAGAYGAGPEAAYLRSSCADPTAEVGCIHRSGTLSGLAAGTYYVFVDGQGSQDPPGAFELRVRASVPAAP